MTTQEKILNQYKEIRGDFLDGSDMEKQSFFNNLIKFRYLDFIKEYKDKRVLEIGCNKGYLLKSLQDNGFKNLNGIDLSESDLKVARKITGLSTLKQEDLFDHLLSNHYDAIICKDVMEHIVKEKQEYFVECIYNSLMGGGIAIVQVPNMDWILSNHERYMDFTHEMGYTRESFADIFRLYFKDVEVLPASYIFIDTIKRKIVFGFLRKIVVKTMRFLFRVLGEGASDVWFEHREIMAVLRKEKGN